MVDWDERRNPSKPTLGAGFRSSTRLPYCKPEMLRTAGCPPCELRVVGVGWMGYGAKGTRNPFYLHWRRRSVAGAWGLAVEGAHGVLGLAEIWW
jgi:hypothetical protein